MANEQIIGHHRSRALAERHLRNLGPGWAIVSRRRASGAYSSHGHTFVFQKEEPPPPPPVEVYEYIIEGRYTRKKASARNAGGPFGNFNIIATGRTRAEAVEAARELMLSERRTRKIALDVEIRRAIPMDKPVNEEPGLAEWR